MNGWNTIGNRTKRIHDNQPIQQQNPWNTMEYYWNTTIGILLEYNQPEVHGFCWALTGSTAQLQPDGRDFCRVSSSQKLLTADRIVGWFMMRPLEDSRVPGIFQAGPFHLFGANEIQSV